LHYKRHSPVAFDEALKSLGWQPTQTSSSDSAQYDAISDAEFEQSGDSANNADFSPEPSKKETSTTEAVSSPSKKMMVSYRHDCAEDVRARELANLINKDNKSEAFSRRPPKAN